MSRRSSLIASSFFAVVSWSCATHALQRPTLPGLLDPTLPAAPTGAFVTSHARSTAPPRGAASWFVPETRAQALSAFAAETSAPASWIGLWDTATSSPIRLFGGAISAPGAIGSPNIAAEHLRRVFDRHPRLFLAGHAISDFDLVTNELDGVMRIIGFRQMAHVGAARVPVWGGRVSGHYKADRLFLLGSEAISVPQLPSPAVGEAQAQDIVFARLASFHGDVALDEVPIPGEVAATYAPVMLGVLPLRQGLSVTPKLAWRVAVHTATPERRAFVFVDALTGEIAAGMDRMDTLSPTLRFNAAVRGPDDARTDFAAPLANIDVANTPGATDDLGVFTAPDTGPVAFETSPTGKLIVVQDFSGAPAKFSADIDPSQDVVWSLASDEAGDAQLSGYIHANIAKAHARTIDPALGFLTQPLGVRVNQDDDAYVCNAFWNGTNINFFREFAICHNTARVADVVYHEFGHAFHTHSILPGVAGYDAAFAEGQADYFAGSITNDPVLAPGFFTTGGHLREFDTDFSWPTDIDEDPHVTGLIFAGAMWDARVALSAEMGEEAGRAHANLLYRAAIRSAPNMLATFPEILAEDDDDGDLGNGTPHICSLLTAFAPHGLTPYLSASGLRISHIPLTNVSPDGPYAPHVSVTLDHPECGTGTDEIKEIHVEWSTKFGGTIAPMSKDGDGYSASLPLQASGTQLRYRIVAEANGLSQSLPDNIADIEYRAFIGDPKPIFCTDFEADAAGFSFGEVDGKTSDFEWSAPAGAAGDPATAFSGSRLIGTTLGPSGAYRKSRASFADSPAIDLGGNKHVRLQFRRWLTVEDGAFDQAQIAVNGTVVWQNAATNDENGTLHHEDKEWRFEDIDITNALQGANTAQIRFSLTSDEGFELGGWNIDDLCLMSWEPPPTSSGAGGGGGAGGAGAGGGDEMPAAAGGCQCEWVSSPAPQRASLWASVFFGLALAATRRRRR